MLWPQRKFDAVKNWNGTRLMPLLPDARLAYGEIRLVITTPGVVVSSVPVMFEIVPPLTFVMRRNRELHSLGSTRPSPLPVLTDVAPDRNGKLVTVSVKS